MLDLFDSPEQNEDNKPLISETELSDTEVLVELKKIKEELKDKVVVLCHHYKHDDVISFTGPAGSAFIENTYGFHRGSNLKEGKRRIFSVTYAITPMRIAADLPSLFDASMDENFLTDLEKYILRLYLK